MRSRFRQFRGGAAALAVVLGTAIGVPIIITVLQGGGTTQPPAGTAHLWVDTTGGTCTRNATAPGVSGTVPAAYIDAAACGSLNAAVQAASQGDTIVVVCGNYGGQTIAYKAAAESYTQQISITAATQNTTCVKLANAGGATLIDNTAHLNISWINATNGPGSGCEDSGYTYTTSVPAGSVPAYKYVAAPCPVLTIQSSTTGVTTGGHDVNVSHVTGFAYPVFSGIYNGTLTDSDFGPSRDNHGFIHCNGSATPCTNRPHDFTFTNVAFHDYFETAEYLAHCPNHPVVSPAPAAGFECGYLGNNQQHTGTSVTMNSAYNVTWDRVHMYNATDICELIKPANGFGNDSITIKNSVIGPCNGVELDLTNTCSTNVSPCPSAITNTNIHLEGDTFLGDIAVTSPSTIAGSTYTGSDATGNILRNWSNACSVVSTLTWAVDGNWYTGSVGGIGVGCGTHTGTGSPTFAADGFHLVSGGPIDLLPTGSANALTVDYDGDARPQGSAIDAGADELVTTQSGASNGLCSPSPCTTGLLPTFARSVSLGSISDGVHAAELRHLGIYLPQNLVTTDPTRKFAVMFMNGGGGASTEQQVYSGGSADAYAESGMGPVADAGKFMIVILSPPASGGSHTGWEHPKIDCGGAGGVVGGGSCGTGTASDVPYIQAALNYITTNYPNADTNRFYDTGGSSGANMARELICDSRTATSFRGVATLGGGPNVKYGTTGPLSCPAAQKDRFYLEVTGSTSNQDPATTINIGTDHTILGLNDGRAAWATYLGGCGSAVHTTTGSQSPPTDVWDYQCSNVPASSQFEAVMVNGGGHTWCFLDTAPQQPRCTSELAPSSNPTGGWSTATWMWNWLAARQW